MRTTSTTRSVIQLLVLGLVGPLVVGCGSSATPTLSPAESATVIEDEVYSPAKFAKAKSKAKTKAAGLKPVSLKQP